ncbi:hypothetical protein D3C74_262200 [compost metagenome]
MVQETFAVHPVHPLISRLVLRVVVDKDVLAAFLLHRDDAAGRCRGHAEGAQDDVLVAGLRQEAKRDQLVAVRILLLGSELQIFLHAVQRF